ncbi:MAG: C25 family cysteine peptidase, partial [Calditrichaceae bacterium]
MKLFELKSILFILICIVAIGTQLYPQVSDLKSIDNQADYLVITTKDFLETIGSLTLYRQSQNLTTQTILTDDIYEQFQDTLSRQEAIRHFVSYALEYWADPKPQFLLLVGDVEFV